MSQVLRSSEMCQLRFYECGPMKQIKAMMKRIDAAVPKKKGIERLQEYNRMIRRTFYF